MAFLNKKVFNYSIVNLGFYILIELFWGKHCLVGNIFNCDTFLLRLNFCCSYFKCKRLQKNRMYKTITVKKITNVSNAL